MEPEATVTTPSAQLTATPNTPADLTVGNSVPMSSENKSVRIREVANGFLVDKDNWPYETFVFATLEEALVKANDILLK